MWHWTNEQGTLGYGDGRQVVEGEALSVERLLSKPVRCCERGLHASDRIIDALKYAPGLRLWKVELYNVVERQDDKAVAYTRVAMRDFGVQHAAVVDFARWCARRAVAYADGKGGLCGVGGAAWDAGDAARCALLCRDEGSCVAHTANAACRACEAACLAGLAFEHEQAEQEAWWQDYLACRYGY